jgi:hypothetical protein
MEILYNDSHASENWSFALRYLQQGMHCCCPGQNAMIQENAIHIKKNCRIRRHINLYSHPDFVMSDVTGSSFNGKDNG